MRYAIFCHRYKNYISQIKIIYLKFYKSFFCSERINVKRYVFHLPRACVLLITKFSIERAMRSQNSKRHFIKGQRAPLRFCGNYSFRLSWVKYGEDRAIPESY